MKNFTFGRKDAPPVVIECYLVFNPEAEEYSFMVRNNLGKVLHNPVYWSKDQASMEELATKFLHEMNEALLQHGVAMIACPKDITLLN